MMTEHRDIYGQIHPVETPNLLKESLKEFETEVEQIKPEKSASLRMAQQKCPQLLTDDFKLMFLRCECFRVKDAAKRYAKYWEARRDICDNDEKCFRPLTVESLLEDDKAALYMGLCQLLPPDKKDPEGRRILFMDSSRQDRNLIGVKSQARAAAYMLMALLEDVPTQQKGMVVIFWPYRETWDQPNREFISLMASSLKGALPVRLSGAHICQPPTFFRLLIPFVKMVMGERLRKRIRFHTGSNKDVQATLEPYGLTKEILPTELGGDVVLDIKAWIDARLKDGK